MTDKTIDDRDIDDQEHGPSITRLNRDLIKAATTLSREEARYLVDAYYISQEDRKRAHNQVRSMKEEPHQLIGWLAEQSETLEGQIKRALDRYAEEQEIGRWAMANYGVGPVITAGLLAHIDIAMAPTVGHIWRFAGLDPTMKWNKGEKRPWNPALKTLCWKIGQCFMKFSNVEACTYGKIYRQRKEMEIARNERGDNAARAAEILTKKSFKKSTDAYKAYSIGKLPPAHVDAQARRYAVKMFLSHLQLCWWFDEYKELPPKPYAITKLEHAHVVRPQHLHLIEGLEPAMRKAGI